MRSEFQFIQHIKDRFSLSRIGDDCAVLPKDTDTDMVMTADMLVEDIDFRLDWTSPESIGHKALAVSLSDIAAMGATPHWAMISLGMPEGLWKSDFADRLYDGWHTLAKQFRVELIGGDISKTPDKLVIDSIAGGDLLKGRAILRSGANIGDAIAVTNYVGGSAGGLTLLKNGRRLDGELESWETDLIRYHLEPLPQAEIGAYLQENQLANAMIDISDGLVSDLNHICVASAIGARLVAEKIPLNLNLVHLTASFDEQLELGLNGGEDFQLLFTIDREKIPQLSAYNIDGYRPVLCHVIGEVTSNVGEIELVRGGKSSKLEPRGYRHF